MKDRYPGNFVVDCVIIVHTTMGPFKLVHGKWIDGIGQPAPEEIIADLDFAHKQKSQPTGFEKVRFDKGDSL